MFRRLCIVRDGAPGVFQPTCAQDTRTNRLDIIDNQYISKAERGADEEDSRLHTHDFTAGDVVSIPFGIGLRHYGVVTLKGTVISRSSRHEGVVEQSLTDFADGRTIKRHRSYSNRHVFEIEARARRVMGADYDLTGGNCVHFVRWTHRRKPTMTQVARGTLEAIRDMLGPPRR